MQYDFVIQGDIVTPDAILRDAQVGICGGKIAAVAADAAALPARERLEAKGQLVFPGFVDAHVHCRSYAAEGIARTTMCAARGGVSTILDMPFDQGETLSTAEALEKKIAMVMAEACVDVGLIGTIGKEGDLSHLKALYAGGICGMKMALIENDPKRFPRINDAILYEALPKLASYGLPVGFHAENGEIIDTLSARAKTAECRGMAEFAATRPPLTESLEVAKLLEFCLYSGIRLYLNHTSLAHSMELAIYYKKRWGIDVRIETCPQYLLLTEEDALRMGARAKVIPPLRRADDLEELWRLVLDGKVDVIATDHAPWPLTRKFEEDVFAGAAGAAGLETFVSVMYTEMLRRKAGPLLMARLMSENPAKCYGFEGCKGAIIPGADADFCIYNPAPEWTIRAKDMLNGSGWSPYEGRKVQGRVTATVLRGKIVYNGRDVLAQPGSGQYLRPNAASA